jgi:hypothetical protein
VAVSARSGRDAAALQIAGVEGMKHRHLNHERFTLAAIEDILSRGSLPDGAPLIQTIKADPFGEVADKTLTVCRNAEIYGASTLFTRLVQTARQRQSGP